MKKLLLTLSLFVAIATVTKAQILPKVQVGIKGGVNLSSLSNSGSTFSADNRAGYLGGIWARFGALGFNFQPELYITSKNVDINSSNGASSSAKFTSIDVPLLLGGKIGAFGLGGRFYAGPLLSFAINKDNSFGSAVGGATRLDYKDSNFAITAGAGIDIRRISIDLRYEAGLTKQEYIDGSTSIKTRVSLFNLSLGYAFL
ncbi:outer membrane beta-barrel protein [Mucilaginibacter aquariorum]|uniref:PorT family protein n=1 Tax=Mucilaginibacter aquariorum TaxID=2967225 RepID=A0ABT1SWH6_9SPHI|nr:outer membrane beta-barrel protein [Mucilaginibacter aquariorum]MCQ6956602.1 PorT family protein [Mucilaginibacter aquariorum]